LEKKRVIGVVVFFAIAISFFSLLFLSIISLNVTYETLAIALLFGSFLWSRFYLEKVKKYRPLPALERGLYFTEIFGVVLMLLSIALVGYENCYIQLFVKSKVWYIWISGVFIVGLREIALRFYRGRFYFKRGVYPKKVEETFMEAKSVTIAPIDTQLNVDKRFSDFIKKRLIKQKLTLRSGQKISLKVLTDFIPFEILETDPAGDVKVTKETTVKILSAHK